MNPRLIVTAILCVVITGHALAQTNEMDKELSDLASRLAILTKDNGKKKVTVLDFTDLQGGTSELGKYIAEQLTVEMVIVKKDFSVLDRANLRKIMAEHKLTASGLVEPENAKKLGMFAGVDALILGNIIPKNQKISLTAKIITTDTAEIVGAARAEFRSDETVQQLLSQVSVERDEAGLSGSGKNAKPWEEKQIGDLHVHLESLTFLQTGRVLLNAVFKNKSSKKSLGVGMYSQRSYFGPPFNLRTSLTGADGTECWTDSDEITGIKSMRTAPQNLTEIAPGKEIRISVKYQPNRAFSDQLTSFRFQAEIVVNSDYKESQYNNYRPDGDMLPPFCKIENVVLQIPLNKK